MKSCECIGSLADWFAATGTISAVIFALYQSSQSTKPKLKIRIRTSTYWTTYRPDTDTYRDTKDKPQVGNNKIIEEHFCYVVEVFSETHYALKFDEQGFYYKGSLFPMQLLFTKLAYVQPFRETELYISKREIDEKIKSNKHGKKVRIKFYVKTVDDRIIFSRVIVYNLTQ